MTRKQSIHKFADCGDVEKCWIDDTITQNLGFYQLLLYHERYSLECKTCTKHVFYQFHKGLQAFKLIRVYSLPMLHLCINIPGRIKEAAFLSYILRTNSTTEPEDQNAEKMKKLRILILTSLI